MHACIFSRRLTPQKRHTTSTETGNEAHGSVKGRGRGYGCRDGGEWETIDRGPPQESGLREGSSKDRDVRSIRNLNYPNRRWETQRTMSLKLGDLKIKSAAFASGHISKRNAGDGENLSPPLEWSGAPKGTVEFALVCHDPDAPLVRGFTHWVLYGIPAATTKLAEGQKPD